MIDPANVIDFDRTTFALQEFAIFAISVAGKSSFVQARKVDALIHQALAWTGPAETLPFDRVRVAISHGRLREAMESVRLGQYTRIGRALTEIVGRSLDLHTCTEEDLASVHGCSWKTAKFILVYSRPDVRAAVLDTHVLRWLEERGHKTPGASPQNKAVYEALERVFQGYADALGVSCAELDEMLWRRSARLQSRTREARPAAPLAGPAAPLAGPAPLQILLDFRTAG